MSDMFSPWSTSSLPTSTYLKSIDPTHTSGLLSILSSVTAAAATESDINSLVSYSKIFRGARASLDIISAEKVLATATEATVKAHATQEIFSQSVNLDALNWEENNYDTYLSRPANIIYLSVFGLLFLYYSFMPIKSRYVWFNVSFWCGYTLEFLGFLGRILSFTDWSDFNYFLLQFVTLTIAPAFIMAGIYFSFGQLVAAYGRTYSLLKPLWYTYIFITLDIISLVIQAVGGAMAADESDSVDGSDIGTNIMIAGIVFQVFSMSVFLILWFEFLNRIFFKGGSKEPSGSRLNKRSFINFMRLLFNTKEADTYKKTDLESRYNPHYTDIRARKLVNYFPLAITASTIVVYIRCVYRVVELAQGWNGYLITHEVFLMTLDALMIAICGIIMGCFHPIFVFGPVNRLKVKHIRNKADVHGEGVFEKDTADQEDTVYESGDNQDSDK